jgi:predicted transposase YdaD
MPRKKNDILLKAAFEDTFLFLLRFFFPDADKIFDFSRGFTFMDKELRELFPELEATGGTRQADMLVKVFLLDGSEKWLLVHIEIQEQHQADFPQRMFRYFYRIYDRFRVGVTAIAVFTGKTKSQTNQFYEELLGTKALYEYNAYHILDHTEKELLAMDNPFALVILAAQKALLADKIPEKELSEARLTIARALIKSGKLNRTQIQGFLFFLTNFLYVGNPEINLNFEKQIDTLTGKTNAMGIIENIKMLEREEGIEEGLEKGLEKGVELGEERKATKFVQNLLATNQFSVAQIATLADVTEAFVLAVQKGTNK